MKTQIWPLDKSNYKETLKGVCILVENFITIFLSSSFITFIFSLPTFISLHPSLPSFLLYPLMPEVVSQIPFPYPSFSKIYSLLSYQWSFWFLLNPGNPFHSSPHLVSWHNLLHWLQRHYSFPYSLSGYFFTVSFMEKLCNIVHGIKYVFNCFAKWMTEYINEWANKIKCLILTN